ncbi:MAG: PEGA domain-containing protein [Bradymonadia bacterium]
MHQVTPSSPPRGLWVWALALCLWAAPALADPGEGSILWRFPGDYGPDVREAVAEAAKGSATQQHLITETQLDAWIDQLPPAKFDNLGCLDDSARCETPLGEIGRQLGLSARVDAAVTRDEQSGAFVMKLVRTPAAGGAPQTFTVRGDDLPTVAQKALKKLGGFFAQVEVKVTPETAEIWAGEQRLGQGSGVYELPVGDHTLRATAPGHIEASQPATLKSDKVVAVVFTLRGEGGRVKLAYTPAHAVVYLGKDVFAEKPGEYPMKPGTHVLRIQADGYQPHEVTAKVAEGQRTPVKVDLVAKSGFLEGFLPPPDPVTTAHPYYVRLGLRGLTMLDGDFDVGGDRLELSRLDESVTFTGLELGVGWRGETLMIEPLSLMYAGGGGPSNGRLSGGDEATLNDLSRWVIKPAWVGVRRPTGPFEPYALAGLVLSFESFEIEGTDPDAAGPATAPKDTSAGRTTLTLGMELGVRYHITEDWFAATALEMEWWPGDRLTMSYMLGGGFAFDWPGGWPKWW